MKYIVTIRCLERSEHLQFEITGMPAEVSNGDYISLSLFNHLGGIDLQKRNWIASEGICFLSCWTREEELFDFLLQQATRIHPRDHRVRELPPQTWG